ncbi:MAG: glycosyltransferase family 4 protein [archaeon]|nr:glycosyltransferase family 4 protein [archaeon]
MSNNILYLSTYPPRECGLATFTRDVSENIQKKFGQEARAKIIAINEDNSSLYNYGKKVVFNIVEQDIKSYEKAAEKINSMKGISLVNIQHEFGLFGGDYGEHLLRLMELTKKKIVTTLHTVLEDPEEDMKRVVQKIFEYSNKIVVMTENAKEILTRDYEVDAEKIVIIPHGAPNIGFKEKNKIKKQMGFEGKTILLTFGLLSRGKGIEHAIRAMPEIIKQNKEAVYLIVGQTHPKVRLDEGESYRQELKELVVKDNVEENVKFVDKYLTLQEIMEFLKMTDVYLAPSIDQKQICSGTVSYAMGAGKPIIASKNKYNEEVLADNRGIIIKRNSGKSFAKQVNIILASNVLRKNLEKNAFEYSRKMTWANVSTKYFNTFSDITGIEAKIYSKLPRISFKHFAKMTDDFGIIQFSDYSTPDIKSGYTLDDNARALIVATKGYEKYGSKRMLKFADTFLNFIEKCQMKDGMFHNAVDENKEFLDEVGSEDSFGRTLLGTGTVLNSTLPETYRLRAKKILQNTASQSPSIISPRAQADSLIGIINSKNYIPEWNGMKEEMLDSLVSKYENVSSGDWNWFEEYLTYGNSRMPEALFEAQDHFNDVRVPKIAKESMDFLTDTLFIKGKFVPVGQEKWFVKNEDRSFFDQQPIEAAEMTTAFVKAYEKTGNQNYLKKARNTFDWFLGKNSHNQMVYDESTGGCFDGLTKTGVNANQGAEAIVSYLIARLSI